ncbi:sensor histidine kinase [Streptomyces sp. NPDC056255]|uniref:sensor histidine kinase n=1 Tax=Streptomyces sp. NPDC056255 TaxID=3345764 RepID=UPI0035E21698
MRNPLDNALRHAATRIDISLRTLHDTARLVVADDGPGIPGADRERVFDRFTRLDDARARDTGGSGLGLAIVRDIVEAHHGTTHIADNRPGTRLIVLLPVGHSKQDRSGPQGRWLSSIARQEPDQRDQGTANGEVRTRGSGHSVVACPGSPVVRGRRTRLHEECHERQPAGRGPRPPSTEPDRSTVRPGPAGARGPLRPPLPYAPRCTHRRRLHR